ncbi:MAG: ferredoxin [Desulfovibrionales bacterium]|nr:ferredoxin [Desulfovibrionales bacterium]
MDMPKRLYIDPKECKACGACEEICPEVFRVDENLGYAQILDLETYPEDKINEAIVACPGRCIDWNESKDAENPPVSPFSKGGSNETPPLAKGQTKHPPLTKGGEGGFSGDNEYFCQKYQEPIKTKPPACPHPLDYCQFRSSCPVHFLEKENG